MPTDAILPLPIRPAPEDTVLHCQACADCGAWQSLRKFACAQCGSRALQLVRASGLGRVRAVTLVHRPPHADFSGPVPYAIALVKLDEGPTLMGRADPALVPGDRVRGELSADRTAHFVAAHAASDSSFS